MIEAVRLSASVFSREAIRAARRWQTWLQRAAFSSALLAWVVSSWTATDPLGDPTTDIDGDPRPTEEGPDFAGADIP